MDAPAREACIAKIREVEALRYEPRAIDSCMATVRQHAPHGPSGDALCDTVEKLLRAGNASRAERLLNEASGDFSVLWVAVALFVTVAFLGALYGVTKSKTDDAAASTPRLVGGAGSAPGAEAALTDATVGLVADLASGRSEAAYGRMSATYRALVSLDRFDAAIAANPVLRGAHDVVPSHWTIQSGTGEVRGSVLDRSGQKTAFTAGFAQEASSWKATAFSIGNVPALPQGPR